MFKEYFDINISENIETIIVYLYESGEQQKNSDLSLKWPKKYRLYHKRLSVSGKSKEISEFVLSFSIENKCTHNSFQSSPKFSMVY